MTLPTTLPEPTTSYTFEYEFAEPFTATTFNDEALAVKSVRVTIAVNLDDIKMWESVYATGYIGKRHALNTVMPVEFDEHFLAIVRPLVARSAVQS